MPAVLQVTSPDLSNLFQKVEPHLCRVSDAGTIILPIIGEMTVAGKTLTEIESLVVDAYFPKYVLNLPAVVCKVAEYRTENVTIIGAVEEPGVYPLRSDEMSLVGLLMKAEGIVEDGAGLITICHPGHSGQHELSETDSRLIASDIAPAEVPEVGRSNSGLIVLPVKGLNIPFADVTLYDGDVVEVERLNPQVFTVMGLVTKPGAFPYPPEVQYNLMEALAFAGGVNLVVDSHYVTIYRQDSNGRAVSATFGIDSKSFAEAANVMIKPGDVVSVEMTPRTRANLILSEMFYIRAGMDFNPLE